MARKSRTQPKQSTDTLKALSKVYKTAIYVRLSAEKDETRDRKTLINQRNLIKNFVDQQMDMEVSIWTMKFPVQHSTDRNLSV